MVMIQEKRKENLDQFAITKAAAWAWYERGSWFDHKSIQEADCKRSHDYTPRPSRYKLEAMKKAQNENYESHIRVGNSTLLCADHVDNSLLDMYEITRISRELDGYVESSRIEHERKSVDGGDRFGGRIVSKSVDGGDHFGRRIVCKAVDGGDHFGRRIVSEGTKSKRNGDNKKHRGFWVRHRIVCGSSSDDVVEHANLIIGGGKDARKGDAKIGGVKNFRRRPAVQG